MTFYDQFEEFGWEVTANLRRMEKDFEKNPILKKLYEKIGDEAFGELGYKEIRVKRI